MNDNKTTFEQVNELYVSAHAVITKALALEVSLHEKRLEKWQNRDVPGVFDRPVFPQQQATMINDIKNRTIELMVTIVALENSLNAQEQSQVTTQ